MRAKKKEKQFVDSKMKVLLLGNHSSSHIFKWSKALAAKSFDVTIFSLSPWNQDSYKPYPEIKVQQLAYSEGLIKSQKSIGKWRYLRSVRQLKGLIDSVKPDLVHAHYASSYGLLGALSGFHPFVISVWGSDVFEFPRKSIFHRLILQFNLRKADRILSTSHVMANETAQYTDKQIEVTPFGIDVEKFKPQQSESFFDKEDLVIGTIKSLEPKYGIKYLIKAFKILKGKNPKINLKLLIVGGGSLEEELKSLVHTLNIEKDVVLTGKVPFEQVIGYYNMLDIYVAVSIMDSESFGVAILEASACEKPVVVSNVGGLPEVVDDGVTGLVVPKRDEDSTAAALERLVLDAGLRKNMGFNGRKRVKELYNWKDCVEQMRNIYRQATSKR